MLKWRSTTLSPRARAATAGLAVVVLIVATAAAFLQKPREKPFAPEPILSLAGFFLPLEWNPHRRGIEHKLRSARRKAYGDAAIFGTRDGRRLWMVTRDFELSSNDGGDSWQRLNVPHDRLYVFDGGDVLSPGQELPARRTPVEQSVDKECLDRNGRKVQDKSVESAPARASAPDEEASGESIDFRLLAMSFADDGLRGVAVGGNGYIVQQTGDGGATWQVASGHANPFRNMDVHSYRQRLLDVALSGDGRTGIAVGTWGVAKVQNSSGGWILDWLERTYHKLRKVVLSSDGRRGLIIGDLTDPRRATTGLVLRTEDGGTCWIETPRQGQSLRAVALSGDGLRAVAAATESRRGLILTSADGGVTWSETATPADVPPSDIALSRDGSRALAVGGRGQGGFVLRRTDDGNQWQEITSLGAAGGQFPPLTSVFMTANGVRAWATGSDGRLFHSSDSGRSWRESDRYLRAPGPWYYATLVGVIGLLFVATRRPQALEPAESQSADHYANDRPVTSAKDDRLNVRPLAEGLSHFLRNRNTEPPLTVAITGPWGSGKSSIMNMLIEDLQNHGFQTVWFNAWHHQSEDSLLAALLEVIRQQGVPPPWYLTGLLFRAKLFWIRFARDLRKGTFLIPVLLIAIAVMFGLNVDPGVKMRIADLMETRLNWSPEVTDLLLNVLGGILVPILLLAWIIRKSSSIGLDPAKLVSAVGRRMSIRDLRDRLGVRHRFAEQFGDVTDALRPWSTLVLVIDDLDRCKPERVVEILESVNFLMVAGRCFVVLGLDMGPILCAVQMSFDKTAKRMAEIAEAGTLVDSAGFEYEDPTAFARHYVEKLINLQAPVPSLDRKKIPDLIRSEKPSRRETPEGSQMRRLWKAVGVIVPIIFMALLAALISSFLSLQVETLADHIAEIPARDVQEAVGPLGRGDQPPQVTAVPPMPLDDSIDPELAEIESDKLKPVPPPPWPRRLEMTSPWAYLAAIAIFALGAFTIYWMQAWESLRPEDDPFFHAMLMRWGAFFKSTCATPRAFKQYQNRIRFLAMRQARSQEGISQLPEPMLAALGALHEHDRSLIDPSRFYQAFDEKSGALVDAGPLLKGHDFADDIVEEIGETVRELAGQKVEIDDSEVTAWPPDEVQLATFHYLASSFYTLGPQTNVGGATQADDPGQNGDAAEATSGEDGIRSQ